jgi:hypothetical protein
MMLGRLAELDGGTRSGYGSMTDGFGFGKILSKRALRTGGYHESFRSEYFIS